MKQKTGVTASPPNCSCQPTCCTVEYNRKARLQDELNRLARHFKVSTLVILRRIHDMGGLTQEKFRVWPTKKNSTD